MTDAAEATDFLHTTRAFYDAIAEDYAEHFRGDLKPRPLERAVLTAFAELVAGDGLDGEVADLGCGPGRVTALLERLGLPVFGVDLSASMLAVARRENPHLRFEQGSILELDLADGALAGALSWYSSIHTPEERLPDLFAEFHRILAPGGRLLVAFQAGDAPLRLERPFGHPVTLDFQRRRPERIEELLTAAGFTVQARLVRESDETLGESAPQAFLTARKPPARSEPAATATS
ncbi:class I SAM-dependent DNA methyltransferase [Streptomyces mexicanus]|jgi:SAM-dependent methyltransferase|uniref:class I SAM-dependent DNA methyltransferase n=1 Tax=Streptomyces mexicanus TaxID=178566 RepID=UPI0036C7D742